MVLSMREPPGPLHILEPVCIPSLGAKYFLHLKSPALTPHIFRDMQLLLYNLLLCFLDIRCFDASMEYQIFFQFVIQMLLALNKLRL